MVERLGLRSVGFSTTKLRLLRIWVKNCQFTCYLLNLSNVESYSSWVCWDSIIPKQVFGLYLHYSISCSLRDILQEHECQKSHALPIKRGPGWGAAKANCFVNRSQFVCIAAAITPLQFFRADASTFHAFLCEWVSCVNFLVLHFALASWQARLASC